MGASLPTLSVRCAAHQASYINSCPQLNVLRSTHLSVAPMTATSASRLLKLGWAAQQRITSNWRAITCNAHSASQCQAEVSQPMQLWQQMEQQNRRSGLYRQTITLPTVPAQTCRGSRIWT